MSEVITTPEGAENPTPETTVPKPEETKVEEKTIGELTRQEEPKLETVGLDKYMKEKKARQDAEKQIAELKQTIEQGATQQEISADIAAIAKEHDIDESFLNKLANTIKAQTEKDMEEKLSSKFKPLEEKEKQAKLDNAFNTHFKQAMENMPEYDGIVNADVIKNLSLLPQNSAKTFSQLIEETYGNAITGKRTVERTTPGGGKEPQPLDYTRATKDKEYFKEVMANPKLKEEYNRIMLQSGF